MATRLWMAHPAPTLRLAVAEGAPGDASRLAWDVGALLLAAGDALQARFGAVTVRGELSALTRAGSGHWYFALKDLDGRPALLRCAMFRRNAGLVDFEPRDGQQVEARGRLAVYEPRGDLQFIVEAMRPLGAGALYEQFLRLKARLESEGLFDAARKRSIDPWPRAIGIVTSTAAAALRDVLVTLSRRAPQVRIVVYPSLVQGTDAPAALCEALRLAAVRQEVDTVLLVRGGGSLEDLWAFNDERVVRAIVASPIPVVCGVGHETDVTLADLAADLRAPTPTAAAELAAPPRAEALAQLDAIAQLLQRRMHQRLDTEAQRLDALSPRVGGPARALLQQRALLGSVARRLDAALRFRVGQGARDMVYLCGRLVRAGHLQIESRQQRWQSLHDRLEALDPRRVLARGFAWIEGAGGRPVLRAADVHPHDRLEARWADGRAQVQVLQVDVDRPR